MAEIQESGNKKGGKSKQKKMTVRVDFTPMVDMNSLPLEEINAMADWKDAKLNEAKDILAYELTKLVHSEAEANKARDASRALFSGMGDATHMPATEPGSYTHLDVYKRQGSDSCIMLHSSVSLGKKMSTIGRISISSGMSHRSSGSDVYKRQAR